MLQTMLIKTDGTIKSVSPKNGKRFTLEESQLFVGGLVNAIYLDKAGVYMLYNESGELIGLEVNKKATKLFERFDGGSEVLGDVLIVQKDQMFNQKDVL